jgi:enamine deaminase RidA (YjgF/YER057c/UK114 family)
MRLLALLALAALSLPAQVRPIGQAAAGHYTPAVFADGYLYVSAQVPSNPGAVFGDQTRQAMNSLKAIVEEAGLTMDNVVYTQVFLEDMGLFEEMNRIYAGYFPQTPPARAVLGVAKAGPGALAISAVAIKDASQKKAINVPGYDPHEPASAGILTADRLFVSGMPGRSVASVPDDPRQQVILALDGLKAVTEAAGLSLAHMVFVNPFLTSAIPSGVMNEEYARRFEFGNTPARATIEVSSVPRGAHIEFTGVAVRDLAQRRAVRPKNMAPSPTASPCVFAGNTLYCSAKSGFIPGINGGIFASTVEHQLRQTMRNLLDNLEEANMDFGSVVSTNVFLDTLPDMQKLDPIYAKYFRSVPPARTVVQQVSPRSREVDAKGVYPTLEQISLIAIKQ